MVETKAGIHHSFSDLVEDNRGMMAVFKFKRIWQDYIDGNGRPEDLRRN